MVGAELEHVELEWLATQAAGEGVADPPQPPEYLQHLVLSVR